MNGASGSGSGPSISRILVAILRNSVASSADISMIISPFRIVVPVRYDLTTSTLREWHSSQLSYGTKCDGSGSNRRLYAFQA